MPRSRSSRPSITTPTRLPLERLVDEIDARLDGNDAAGGTLLRLSGYPPQISYLPLEGEHPSDSLLGLRAPASWLALGMHCVGRAYPLRPMAIDDDMPLGAGYELQDPTPVVFTLLIDRSGTGAGLMRQGSLASRLPGVPGGIIGDACLRAFDLATPPPPPSTAELWLRIWLDRVVESVTFADEPWRYDGWETVTALHPAAAIDPVRLVDPWAVADATHSLAEAWPWGQLRQDPEVVPTTGPPMSRELAAWMDDGMFARAVLADLAPLPLLTKSIEQLLPLPLADDICETILAAGFGRLNADEMAR